jgi:hypothetical protein
MGCLAYAWATCAYHIPFSQSEPCPYRCLCSRSGVGVLHQVPPVVTHTKLGTLYEEPCIVYFKVTTWALPYFGAMVDLGCLPCTYVEAGPTMLRQGQLCNFAFRALHCAAMQHV